MNDDWLFFKKGTRGQWNNMFKILKTKEKEYYHLRILWCMGADTSYGNF